MLNPKRLLTTVEAFFAIETHLEIGEAAIRSRLRGQRVCFARAVWVWLVWHGTHMSQPEIAAELGGRDHTTVGVAIRKIDGKEASRAVAEVIERWIHEQRGLTGAAREVSTC